MSNTLRIDPSKTATLRRVSLTELKGRFLALAARLSDNDPDSMTTVQYISWMEEQADELIYRTLAPFVSKLTADAYALGVGRAYDETKGPALRPAQSHAAARGQFLESVMPAGAFNTIAEGGRPRTPPRVEAAAARFYSEVDATARHALRLLIRELVASPAGQAPAAATVRGVIDGVIKKNVVAVANTEIVRAHAWGQLDGFAALGFHKVVSVGEVDIDGKACADCGALADIVTPISKAYAVIPAHPCCRCAWASYGRAKR